MLSSASMFWWIWDDSPLDAIDSSLAETLESGCIWSFQQAAHNFLTGVMRANVAKTVSAISNVIVWIPLGFCQDEFRKHPNKFCSKVWRIFLMCMMIQFQQEKDKLEIINQVFDNTSFHGRYFQFWVQYLTSNTGFHLASNFFQFTNQQVVICTLYQTFYRDL